MAQQTLVARCEKGQEGVDLDLVEVDGMTPKKLSALYLDPDQIAQKSGYDRIKLNANFGRCVFNQCVYSRT